MDSWENGEVGKKAAEHPVAAASKPVYRKPRTWLNKEYHLKTNTCADFPRGPRGFWRIARKQKSWRSQGGACSQRAPLLLTVMASLFGMSATAMTVCSQLRSRRTGSQGFCTPTAGVRRLILKRIRLRVCTTLAGGLLVERLLRRRFLARRWANSSATLPISNIRITTQVKG